MKPQHLFFDLDGTLTDPKEGIANCFLYAFKELDLPAPSEATLDSFIGPSLQESFSQVFGSEEKEKIQLAIRLYRERYKDIGLFENRPYEGISELLNTAKANSDRLWVATTKPVGFAKRILEKFNLHHFFDGIYGAELDGTRSDKAELLSYIQSCEKISGSGAMIGDRKFDILAGKAHGYKTVGVTWGYGSRDELTEHGVDLLVDSPQDLEKIIRSCTKQ